MSRRSADPTALGRAFRRRLRSAGRQAASGKGAVRPVLGGIVSEYLHPSLANLQADAGYDFCYLETEHGYFYTPQLPAFVHTGRARNLPAIAKTEIDRGEAARLLEAGVCALQLPRTESAEQLAALADLATFPPGGSRAGAPGYGNTDYAIPEDHAAWLRRANQSISLVAHIETAAGYENAAEIVASRHVDVVYVGPYDFAIAMGHPGDYDHPAVVAAMRRILELCVARGVCFGTTASGPKAAKDWIRRGARFFEMSSELDLISHGARSEVTDYRAAT
jgi:2-keto-3-deoxy-L-rhamnonate aldolase RhmA